MSLSDESIGSGVVVGVGGGGCRPLIVSALPSNGLKYCTKFAYRRAVFCKCVKDWL